MNIDNYFRSITKELKALQNRVRDFIDDAHWLTDGEWKESVLRTMIKRHMPSSYKIGRGFVITEENVSKQIDILIYDSSKPILYQDGDLLFVSPDSAKVIIEVKTSLNYHTFESALESLCSNANRIRVPNTGTKYFGLFAYESDMTDNDRILSILQEKVDGKQRKIIKYISLGNSKFIRYWHQNPIDTTDSYKKWHIYDLAEKAPAYFINNIIGDICRGSVALNQSLWYPRNGKESYKAGQIDLRIRR